MDIREFLKKFSMRKMYKITNIALIFMLIGEFLYKESVYPAPGFHLRPALQFNNLAKGSKESVQEEEMWPDLRKAAEQFRRIISEKPRSFVKISLPFPITTICPGYEPKNSYDVYSVKVEPFVPVGEFSSVDFQQNECVVAYTNSERASIDMTEFVTYGFGPCFVFYFFAIDSQDDAKKIFIALHVPVAWIFNINIHRQLFLFGKTLMDSCDIKQGMAEAAFYGDNTIAEEVKKLVKKDFYDIFLGTSLDDIYWGVKGRKVTVSVNGNSLNKHPIGIQDSMQGTKDTLDSVRETMTKN